MQHASHRLTIVQPDVGSSSSKSLFPTEETESVQAVVEVYVDDLFAELGRASDESTAVVRRSVADGERSTIEPLINTIKISGSHSEFYEDSRRQPEVCSCS